MRQRRKRGLFLGTAWAAAWLAGLAPGSVLAQSVESGGEGEERAGPPQARSADPDPELAEYRAELKQIESLRVYNRQTEDLIEAQKQEMVSLQAQIDRIQVVGRGITPLMFKMVEALDQFIHLDVPFAMEERERRIAELREVMDRSDVSDAEKFRRILEAYQIENELGRTVEAYRGEIDQNGKKTTVDFLRVGRIALLYQTLDRSRNGVWDQAAGDWRELDPSYASAIQQGLRVARKQAAPDMIRLPLPAAEGSGGEV